MNFLKRITRKIEKRRQDWELLCKKCGICCFSKDRTLFHTTIKLDHPCEYFNRATKLCKVYENRFSTCQYCGKVTIYHALFSRELPASCGYVERYRRFRFINTADIKT